MSLASPFLFHVTRRKNVPKILEKGVRPTDDGYRQSLENDLSDIARDQGLEFPIKRQDCVFFYPSLGGATELMSPMETDVDDGLSSRQEGIIVVNSREIKADLFVGEFKLISDAIDFQHMDEPDDAMISESYEQALQRYAASLTQIASFDSLEEVCSRFRIPEVVIEGEVQPGAVVECVFLKAIQSASR